MIKLSVIIPVYNTEKYIVECLESVIQQSIKELEIIIIDDGSTDASSQIIKSYIEKNSNSQIIYKYQTNKGQGAARNLGICMAKGKYIYFMDSDDILEPNFLGEKLEEMVSEELDALFFDGDSFFDSDYDFKNNFNPNYMRKSNYGHFSDGESLLLELYRNSDFIVSPCLYILSTDVIKKHNILFPENIKLEDEYFTIEMMLTLEKCKHISEIGFHRRIRTNSTMTSSSSDIKLTSSVILVKLFDELYENFNFENEQVRTIVKNRIEVFYKHGTINYRRIKNKSEESTQNFKLLNIYAKKYNYFSVKTKLFTLLTRNIRIYDFITKVRN